MRGLKQAAAVFALQMIQVQAFRKEMLMTRGASCSNGTLGALPFISLGALPSHHIGHDGGGCAVDFLKQHCGKSELSIPTTTHTECAQLTPPVHCTAVQPLLQHVQARAKLRARSDWAPGLSSDCFPHVQCAVQTVRALMDFEASWLYRQQKDLRDTSRCRCTVVALTATDGRMASKTRPTSPCVFTVPSPIHDGSGASYCCSVPLWPIRLWHGLKRKMLTLLLA